MNNSNASTADQDFADSSKAYLLKQQRKAIELKRHKMTIRRSIRAKKLNQRQLLTLLESLEGDKSNSLKQIDKEVAEIEKNLGKLLSDKNEAAAALRKPHPEWAKPNNPGPQFANVGVGSNIVGTRNAQTGKRTVSTPGEIWVDKCDRLSGDCYSLPLDDIGNPLKVSPARISVIPSSGYSDSHVAWDTTDFSPSDLCILSSKCSGALSWSMRRGTKSRVSTGSASQNVDILPGTGTLSGNITRNKSAYNAHTSQSDDDSRVYCETSFTIPNLNRLLVVGPDTNGREAAVVRPSSTANGILARGQTEGVIDEDGVILIVKMPNEMRKRTAAPQEEEKQVYNRLPHRFDLESNFSKIVTDDDGDAAGAITNNPHSCRIPDCIFHDWTLRNTDQDDPDNMLQAYYQTALLSRAKVSGAPVIRPVFQVSDYLRSGARGARRIALTSTSPSPSDIFRDIPYTPKYSRVSTDCTDLDVIRSVRRPVRGSNREQMLKDKEANVRHTFGLMRKKMAAKIPQDFNANYGTPTPNWKVLNPLQMKHKINHSSPLHRLWKQ